MSTTIQKAMRVLKEFAPQSFQEVTKPESISSLTVVIYHSVATQAGFVAKTTYSMQTGKEQFKSVIEYCYLEDYQLFIPEKLAMQLVKETYLVREYRVSTLPLTLQRVRSRKPVTLSDGLQAGLFQE
ncbi:MAG: hypothetical protein KF908_15125 [Nitrosomonas sp.]|nr:hypothetical protein [Nitrosomonas sp.]MCW5608979.1 hypothetical protein [Nitrosomonas sp.]